MTADLRAYYRSIESLAGIPSSVGVLRLLIEAGYTTVTGGSEQCTLEKLAEEISRSINDKK